MSDNVALRSILFMSANPYDPRGRGNLRLHEEEREIRDRLRYRVTINSVGAVRTRDIQRAMLDYNPQIVHFSGHGSGQDGLVFEDAVGQGKLVSSEALATLFRLFSSQVKCVVLNACYSKFQAEAIAHHIDYVIGMSQSIGDKAAIEFSVGFYNALGAGQSIDFAYELGCNQIQLEGVPGHLIPVLLRKSNTSNSPNPKPPFYEPEKGSIKDNSRVNPDGRLRFIDQGTRLQLEKELKELDSIDDVLVKDKDTRAADNNLRQWKKRITGIIGDSDLYDIQPDSNQKIPYNQTRNVIKKCRIFVEELLASS